MKKIIGFGLLAQCLLFQIFLVTQARFLYGVLRLLFFAYGAVLILALFRRLKKEPVLIVFLLLIILIRIPFYSHFPGLITTSDNAMDALQVVEMRDSHAAPFFQLGDLKHIGTIKYLWVAFIGDAGGRSYLFYVLLQTALLMAFLFALEALLRERLSRPAVYLVLFASQFAFSELIFDYSLSIRGAPYLEMILFFTLGLALFDFTFRDRAACFTGAYLIFFSIYLHPLASVLAGSAGAAVMIFSLLKKKAARAGLILGSGAVAALWHWAYYLRFAPPLVSGGAWEQIETVPFAGINLSYLGLFAQNTAETFRNLFSFEYGYLGPAYLPKSARPILDTLNSAIVWVGLAALAVAIFVLGRKIVRLAFRKDALTDKDWFPFFFFILMGASLLKTFLFFPAHPEPRHNFDWMYLLILAVTVATGLWIGSRKFISVRGAAILILAAALTVPHYEAYRLSVVRKEGSHRELMSLLHREDIRAVSTDFIIAYPIYYFSGRRVEVSDSTGPLSVKLFFPEMGKKIDALPLGRKAYIFFSNRYPARDWHKSFSLNVLVRTEKHLREAGISYTIEETPDYTVVIPDTARKVSPGPIGGRLR